MLFTHFNQVLSNVGSIFLRQKFDKSMYCIVILTPRATISRVFKMVIYEIVRGHSFQLWNRTVVRELFLIFEAVIVRFVLETSVCFKHNLRSKQSTLFPLNVRFFAQCIGNDFENVHLPCFDLRKPFSSMAFLTEFLFCWQLRAWCSLDLILITQVL